MSVTLSTSMASGLSSLLALSDQMNDTNRRIATGKSINDYGDGPGLFLRARNYTDKADALTSVNGKISEAVKNLDTVKSSIDTMYKNMDGALTQLKDARAKAVNVATTVKTSKVAAKSAPISWTATGSTSAPPLAPTIDTAANNIRALSLVDSPSNATTANSKMNDSSVFQQGDTFAVTVTDSKTGVNTVKWFRAVAGSASTNAVDRTGQTVDSKGNATTDATKIATADGSSEIQAYNFNTYGNLFDALTTAFGKDTLDFSFDVTKNKTTDITPTSPTKTDIYDYSFSLVLKNAGQSIQFTNVFNNDPSVTDQTQTLASDQATYTTTDSSGNKITNSINRGTTFDFSNFFGNMIDAKNNKVSTRVLTTNSSNLSGQNTALTSSSRSLQSFMYSAAGDATSLASALEARATAADTLRSTFQNYTNMLSDASMPGFANLLKGETMSVALNETGEVKQNITLSSLDLLTLGWTGYGVDATTGSVTSDRLKNNFDSDTDLDSAISTLNSNLKTLRLKQNVLDVQSAMLKSRSDYNKTMTSNLRSGADEITSADTTTESANLGALQNRSSLALSGLSIIKSAEQSLGQLLR